MASLINPTILLPRLAAELRRSAVRFRRRQFESTDDFALLKENIVINCTGYGAKALMNDEDVIAKRGHLVVLRRTEPKQFYFQWRLREQEEHVCVLPSQRHHCRWNGADRRRYCRHH